MRVQRLAAAFALGSSILIGLPLGAGADPDPRAPLRPPKAQHPRPAQILLDMNDALGVERTSTGALQIRKTYGLEYAHRFEQKGGGAMPVIFSIQGPAIPRKRVGLEIQLRF